MSSSNGSKDDVESSSKAATCNPLLDPSSSQGDGPKSNASSMSTIPATAPSTSGASDRHLLGDYDLADWLTFWMAKRESGGKDLDPFAHARPNHKHWTPDRGTGDGCSRFAKPLRARKLSHPWLWGGPLSQGLTAFSTELGMTSDVRLCRVLWNGAGEEEVAESGVDWQVRPGARWW